MTEPMPSAGVAKGNLLAGKRGLIMGLANNRSIAWGIARAAAAQGAELAFTYQGDALKKRVEPLAAELGSKVVLPCDVVDAASMDAVFAELQRVWGRLDFFVQLFSATRKGSRVQSSPTRPRSCFRTDRRRLSASRRRCAPAVGFVFFRIFGTCVASSTSARSFSRQSSRLRSWSR